jgi:hypothetical protein
MPMSGKMHIRKSTAMEGTRIGISCAIALSGNVLREALPVAVRYICNIKLESATVEQYEQDDGRCSKDVIY